MAEGYRTIITPGAAADFEQIHRSIAADSTQNANQLIKRLFAAIQTLERFPHRTLVERQSPRLRHPVRSLPVLSDIIYFRVLDDERRVRILHVRHGARRQPRRFPE